MSLNDFLVYLVGGGAIVVVSWLLEQFQWFKNLAAKSKQLVFFSCSLVVALAAYAVQTYVPALVLAQLAPYFTIIAATFVAIYLGSSFHANTKISTSAPVQPLPAPAQVPPGQEKALTDGGPAMSAGYSGPSTTMSAGS